MGGKKDKSEGLGRALMRQHNQMVRASKDKSRALHLDNSRASNVLESVTEVSDIDAIVERANEAELLYSISNSLPAVPLDLDEVSSSASGMSAEEWRRQQLREEAFHAASLRVPRRPPWNTRMTVEELDANERQAFIVWRRSLARLEENQRLVLTPFEKNLDIWRQLWRVLERSDLLVMVVDARDPLFYRCSDLEAYAREVDPHKKTLLLLNKADLLPPFVRQRWAEYFRRNGILFLFWSAKAASAALEGKKLKNDYQEVDLGQDSKVYGRDELLARLQIEAEAIVASRKDSSTHETESNSSDNGSVYVSQKRVIVGFVGYPNVGKSSTINALVGEKRTGVTSTPGKTKHFQTLIISDELMLCDCPGLVFPSFSSSRFDMIASGVLPIDRMTEHRGPVQVVANKVPRYVLENIYNIKLPKPKPYESQSRPPVASELLRAYCASRGHVSSSGLPDETRAARQILKDYIDGRLPHYEMPPGTSETNEGVILGIESAVTETDGSDSCDSDDEMPTDPAGPVDAETPNLMNLVDDLDSFDLSELSTKSTTVAKKKSSTNHKHHKKPQRKKDRSWRVGNDNADGMPVVRVFQKPAVNLSAIKTPI